MVVRQQSRCGRGRAPVRGCPGRHSGPVGRRHRAERAPLAAGEGYTLRYTATSTVPLTIRTNVQLGAGPWTTELSTTQQVGESSERVSHTRTAAADHDAAQLAFQLGCSDKAFAFCTDEVSLRGGTAPPPHEPDTGSPVRVNQVGHLTHGPKNGTYVTEATEHHFPGRSAPSTGPGGPVARPSRRASTPPHGRTSTPSTSAHSPPPDRATPSRQPDQPEDHHPADPHDSAVQTVPPVNLAR